MHPRLTVWLPPTRPSSSFSSSSSTTTVPPAHHTTSTQLLQRVCPELHRPRDMADVEASPSYATNLAPAVAKRLQAAHECVCTLYCRNVSDDRSRVFAIVRNAHSSAEHCLLVFKFTGLKSLQSLKLLRAVPIIETTAVGYDKAGVISVYAEGQLVEHAAAPVISDCDEFSHQLLQHVYVAVLQQFRSDRTHGTPHYPVLPYPAPPPAALTRRVTPLRQAGAGSMTAAARLLTPAKLPPPRRQAWQSRAGGGPSRGWRVRCSGGCRSGPSCWT